MNPADERPLTPQSVRPTPTWRRVLAGILDFFTAFIGFGYLIAWLTGNMRSDGFQLEGLPALYCFALVIGYFVIGRRIGGPIWRRLLARR